MLAELLYILIALAFVALGAVSTGLINRRIGSVVSLLLWIAVAVHSFGFETVTDCCVQTHQSVTMGFLGGLGVVVSLLYLVASITGDLR